MLFASGHGGHDKIIFNSILLAYIKSNSLLECTHLKEWGCSEIRQIYTGKYSEVTYFTWFN